MSVVKSVLRVYGHDSELIDTLIMEEEEFVYEPLPSDGEYIRLLCATESPREDSDTIDGNFLTMTLTELAAQKITWFALSYTWDLPEEVDDDDGSSTLTTSSQATKYVRIQGKTISIRRNLFDVLDYFCNRFGGIAIWADAISINQSDEIEKDHQIKLMCKIYSQASLVIVWLGRDAENHAETVESGLLQLEATWDSFVENQSNSLLEARQEIMLNYEQMCTINPSERLTQFGIPNLSLEMWLCIARFFNNRWFTRLWCVQETVFGVKSTGDISAIFGNSILPLTRIYKVSRLVSFLELGAVLGGLLYRHEPQTLRSRGDPYPNIGTELVRVVHILRIASDGFGTVQFLTQSDNLKSPAAVLLSVLFATGSFNASRKKDSIFAILGLVDSCCTELGLPSFPLEVEYTTSFRRLFVEIAQKILEITPNVGMLSLCQRVIGDASNIPSWVPNFTVKFTRPLSRNRRKEPKDEKEYYHAATAVNPDPFSFLTAETDVLTVSGAQIGTITQQGLTGTTSFSEILSDAALILKDMPSSYGNGQSRLEALCRTLIGDILDCQCPAPETCIEEFLACAEYAYIKELDTFVRKAKEGGSTKHENHLLLLLAEGWNLTWQSAFQRVWNAFGEKEQRILGGGDVASDVSELYRDASDTRWRMEFEEFWTDVYNLFWTQEQYLGFGMRNLRVGDTVWLLAGARTPFVLRREESAGDDAYELVCECYLHGVMQGEALEGDAITWRRIRLV